MPPTRSLLHLKKSPKAQAVSPADTGNDDASGEPVGNRGNGDAPPAGHEEAANGDRGAASGRNQEQMDEVSGKPGAP